MLNSAEPNFSWDLRFWHLGRATIVEWLKDEKPQLPLLLPICFAVGIGLWFLLPLREHWLIIIFTGVAIASISLIASSHNLFLTRWCRWLGGCAMMVSAGIMVIWAKSLFAGATPLTKPWVGILEAQIQEVEALPARGKTRLYVTPENTQYLPKRLRLTIDNSIMASLPHPLISGMKFSARVRLMPPNGPVVPGGYNFAQRAWFDGLGGTGSFLSSPDILKVGHDPSILSKWRSRLSSHVQEQLPASQGGIAAILATGDRGGLADVDAEAMRRSGLAHLLALSGLHVSAVIGAVFLIVVKLLAISPALALKFRLPVLAGLAGALAGLGYTIFTGAEVPTVRACIAAMLILLALIIGRDPISLRMVGFAAFIVLLIWPEALVGPSFQMSFAAVVAIIGLYDTPYMRRLSLMRDEGDFAIINKIGRFIFMLFLTGLVIEISLIPIALYHFNKAGIYGALANLIAIPLTTFVIMPLEALALLADSIDLGQPFWWLCGKALAALLALAHFVSSVPGSNIQLSAMPVWIFITFIIGGLALFCLRSPLRFLAVLPFMTAVTGYIFTPSPDLIIAEDGRQFAVRNGAGEYLMLRPLSTSFATDMIREQAGMENEGLNLQSWEQARCSRDFCSFNVQSAHQNWVIMASISNNYVPLRDLSAACARSDIVIAPRRLPYLCKPRWLKIDGPYLRKNGGLLVDLQSKTIISTKQESDHGWLKAQLDRHNK